MARKLLPMPIANRLYNLRLEGNLTKEEVARRLDVTKQAVHQWENGTRIPRTANLVALADIYVTSVDYILGRAETKLPTDWKLPCPMTGEELLDIAVGGETKVVSCRTCRYRNLPIHQTTPCGSCGNTFDNWEAKKED